MAVSPRVVELDGPFAHQMLHTRGLRLHVAVAGQRDAPLVMLLHGAFGGWFDFRHVLAPLAAHGFRAAALDARGYGMSDKPVQRGGDRLLLAAGDVKGAIAALGHRNAVVVGADTGAVVARAVAATGAGTRVVSLAAPTRREVVLRRALSHVPSPLFVPAVRAHAYRRHLRLTTSSSFHSSPEFEELLKLRLQAAAIDHSAPYILANSKLLSHKSPRLTAPELALEGSPHVERPLGFAERVASFLACDD
ncbi:alpha/beta fold hydrolase [Corynebacterium mayonis]|uniref:alpha/beta fold hydrolase n=1 Tax=Corynebacterium mayonis TaxID=3062461 RepID=UPI00313FEC70